MDDRKLIFLISQPRSGSSLLQQLMLTHPQIDSSPESWQMLSLIHTYKVTNLSEGYNPKFTIKNFIRELNSIDDGLTDYKKKIRRIALELYEARGGNETMFLDKTPRYYHIIEELYELFPNAKYIFMVRNPLAVFSSILSYNFHGDHLSMLRAKDRWDDLFLAPENIAKALPKIPHLMIPYEGLIDDTEGSMNRIYDFLRIEKKGGASYEVKNEFSESVAVDTKSLSKHTAAVPDYLNSWKSSINNTQAKKLALDYLKLLRNSSTDYFNYNLDEIIKELVAFRPEKKTYFNLSMKYLAMDEENLTIFQLVKRRLFTKWQKRLWN